MKYVIIYPVYCWECNTEEVMVKSKFQVFLVPNYRAFRIPVKNVSDLPQSNIFVEDYLPTNNLILL